MSSSLRWIFLDFFPFRRRWLRYFVLSALDIGEYKRFNGSIDRNLRELSWLIFESPWLWNVNCGNSYILITFVDLLQSRQIHAAQSLSGQIFFGIGVKRSIRVCLNQGTANYVDTVCFIHQGKYAKQSHGVCLH